MSRAVGAKLLQRSLAHIGPIGPQPGRLASGPVRRCRRARPASGERCRGPVRIGPCLGGSKKQKLPLSAAAHGGAVQLRFHNSGAIAPGHPFSLDCRKKARSKARTPTGTGTPAMSEGFFRYVALSRVAAYEAAGWQMIGSTRSPHDAQMVAIMEWDGDEEPIEPTAHDAV